MLPPSKIVVGRLGVPYGLQGWIKVQSFTDPPANLFLYPQGWLRLSGQEDWQPYQAKFKQQSKALLVQFADCKNPETARRLTGSLLSIDREILPKLQKNEYYWSDLENLKVITATGSPLGTVDYLITTGSNDVMVVKEYTSKKERLIPYTDEVLIQIDLKKQEIIVDWDLDF